MSKIQIYNQQTLKAEKQRLTELCQQRENSISEKLSFVKNHYDVLIVNSMMPFDENRNEKISGVLDFLNTNILSNITEAITGVKKEFSQKALKVAETLLIGLGSNLVDRFFKEKK